MVCLTTYHRYDWLSETVYGREVVPRQHWHAAILGGSNSRRSPASRNLGENCCNQLPSLNRRSSFSAGTQQRALTIISYLACKCCGAVHAVRVRTRARVRTHECRVDSLGSRLCHYHALSWKPSGSRTRMGKKGPKGSARGQEEATTEGGEEAIVLVCLLL